METEEREAFRELAQKAAIPVMRLKMVFDVLAKYKYTLALVIDMMTHFFTVFNGGPEMAEGTLTVILHVFSCLAVFPIVMYSSSGRCIMGDLFLLIIGCYDVQWYCRKYNNDRVHKAILTRYLRTTNMQRDPQSEERQALVCISANNLVDLNLQFTGKVINEFLMAIFKLHFAMSDLNNGLCSFESLTRIPIIVFGLWDVIKICLEFDLATVTYLKAHYLTYYLDSGCRNSVNSVLGNKATMIINLLFHATFVVYRVWTIVSFFEYGVGIGFMHLVFLLLTSSFHHALTRPHYQNPPVGVSTCVSDMVEIVGSIITIRNTHICKTGVSQIVRRLIFFGNLWVQHMIPLATLHFTSARLNDEVTANFTSCNSTVYDWVSSGVDEIRDFLKLSEKATLEDFIFFNVQSYLAYVLIVFSLIHFLTLHFAHLIQDKFPTHTTINIWEKKMLVRSRWGSHRAHRGNLNTNPFSWLEKMILLTVLSPEKFKRFVAKPPKTETDWFIICNRETLRVSPEYDSSAARNSLVGHPMQVRLSDLIAYSEQYPVSFSGKKLIYLLCMVFEDQMEIMDAERIRYICKFLGVSPVVPSEFTDDRTPCNLFIFCK